MEQPISNISPPAGHVLCPSCNYELPYYDAAHSQFFGCTFCGLFFSNEDAADVQARKKKYLYQGDDLIIPLGTTTILANTSFTVVAQLVKRDTRDHDMVWREYLLHSPDRENYYTLAETDGKWQLIWAGDIEGYELFEPYSATSKRYEIRKKNGLRTYRRYADYHFTFLTVRGEFDWNVIGEAGKNHVTEYVSIYDVIVSEEMDGETKWYFGSTVDTSEIARAFQIPMQQLLALKKYEDDETKADDKWEATKKVTWYGLALFLAIWLFTCIAKPSTKVYEGYFPVRPDTSKGAIYQMNTSVSMPFKITSSGPVNLALSAPMSNDWIEVSVEMVNDETGRTFEVTKAIEYYSGYDGEAWSEGSQSVDVIFSAVPAGTYHLNVMPYYEHAERVTPLGDTSYSSPPYPASLPRQTLDIHAEVEQNTSLTSNWWLMLTAILIVPLFRQMAVHGFDND